ncbi:VanZ family protein [Alicyclobacillus fodiniaquatilis]|uniref:VanZ family protein n=1 Tax=Alicyclobacillus fodiniaquatilis TaxID=1661150 RepID=A0ABW4JQ06_9BACL
MDFQSYVAELTYRFPCSKREKRDIGTEIIDHLEMLKQEFVNDGYREPEAIRCAIEVFGDKQHLRRELLQSLPLVDRYLRRKITILYFMYGSSLIYFFLLSQQRFTERSFILHREAMVPEYRYVFHNAIPFHTIYRYFIDYHDYGFYVICSVLFGNILLFLPLGFLSPFLFPGFQRIFPLFSLILACSLWLQLLQGVLALGRFDVDAILLNCLGGFVGYVCYKITVVYLNKYKQRISAVSGA